MLSSALLCGGGGGQLLVLLLLLLSPPPRSLRSPLRPDISCYFMCRGSLSAGSFSSARLCASDFPSPGWGEKEGVKSGLFLVCGGRETDPQT